MGMKYTKIPTDAFSKIQMNAGILVRSFNPATGEATGLFGATTGGVQFTATPAFTDFGEDIDNCPKNMKELKNLDSWDVNMAGTFVTVDSPTAKILIAAADVDTNDASHIIPRRNLEAADFMDIWWIGDYSNVNTGADAGFCAVHLINALNTGGFQIKSTDKGKGNFAFTFTGHVSMDAQDVVPFELYVKAGGEDPQPSITLNKHVVKLNEGSTEILTATIVPDDAEVTWGSADTEVASVSNGEVTATGEGNAIITASITVDGVTYDDTCTVVVTTVAEG
jgi:hypothetical protein